jgi:hypothetical protein
MVNRVTRTAQGRLQYSFLSSQLILLTGMALGLALFYWGGSLVPALVGLLLFGALALPRPDLGLLFVPLTAPLYLIPASISGLRASDFAVPVHEAALLAVLGATAAGWLWRWVNNRRTTLRPRSGQANDDPRTKVTIKQLVREYAPHLLFLLAGVLGVVVVVERGPALIEFRRLIVEPLIFYALLKFQIARETLGQETTVSQFSILHSQFLTRLLAAFALSGALVGLLGLLQYVGLDLVPLLGAKACFCENVVVDGGARRVASVYGHPNNLGLYLGGSGRSRRH